METPIINPDTLTDEQRDAIRAEYDFNALSAGQFAKGGSHRCAEMREWHQGKCDELISLFGKDFF